jgi:peptidyl-tRNA hydrolase, PTH1 family
MTYLIVCLGNPGLKYKYNRHNIGFLAGDKTIKSLDLNKVGKKFKSKLYEGQLAQTKIYLIKPETYMNCSGEAVQLIKAFYKTPNNKTLVVYDDFDLPFGKVRIRMKGRAGTHNGMKSIVTCLGTTDFPRLRIGIGPLPPQWDVSNFVLANFNKEETIALPDILAKASNAITSIVEDDIQLAMNKHNQ